MDIESIRDKQYRNGPKRPEAVVIDTLDGYTFNSDGNGLFTVASARAFADQRNDERKPQYRTCEVHLLVSDSGVSRGRRRRNPVQYDHNGVDITDADPDETDDSDLSAYSGDF